MRPRLIRLASLNLQPACMSRERGASGSVCVRTCSCSLKDMVPRSTTWYLTRLPCFSTFTTSFSFTITLTHRHDGQARMRVRPALAMHRQLEGRQQLMATALWVGGAWRERGPVPLPARPPTYLPTFFSGVRFLTLSTMDGIGGGGTSHSPND